MKPLDTVAVWMMIAIATLMAPALGRCQGGKAIKPAEHLAALKVGNWVEIEGVIQADSSALCTQLKQLTGDFFDDDWSIRGIVNTVDLQKGEFTIGLFRVRVTDNTAFESGKGTLRKLADLRPGTPVDVEGAYLRNREFLAAEVDDEAHEIGRQPRARGQIRVVGKIERVDARKHLIAAMGLVFRVTEQTQLRSVIR